MMRRTSVITHICIALSLISASLLTLAHGLGFVPDVRGARLEAHRVAGELVARVVSSAADEPALALAVGEATPLIERHPGIASIGVRADDGRLIASTSAHERWWSGDADRMSMPLLREGRRLADVEVAFRGSATGVWWSHPLLPLLLFVAGGGFLAYRLYMARVLKYLDPSAAIPPHVRMVLDSLAECVVILDTQERIVLINRMFATLIGRGLPDIIGRRMAEFGWVDDRTGEAPIPAPWTEALEDGLPRDDFRARWCAIDHDVILSVNCAPIMDGSGARRGVLVSLADMTELEHQKANLELLVQRLSQSRTEITEKNIELQRLATTDQLTGCLNRRALLERTAQEWSRAVRQKTAVSCIMIDADHFKQVNDTHGHQAGDRVLAGIGEILRASARAPDIVGRYGGEEFCLILPDTDARGARVVAERVRAMIASADFGGLRVTASLGVADNAAPTGTAEVMLERADRAMYAAKTGGRNRVEVLSAPDQRGIAA
jgi:diguanylate cyclase (GGDEF)-like protein/PAS domain S-box-containing protein